MCAAGEYDDPENGITLNATLHRAFDNRLFTIGLTGQVFAREGLNIIPMNIVVDLSDKQQEYMAGHRAWFLRSFREPALKQPKRISDGNHADLGRRHSGVQVCDPV